MTFAVIPAAGQSRRMGRPKLLLPLGGRTVLEHVVGAFRAAGIERVLVITAPGAAELTACAAAAGAAVLTLAEETPDMRATLLHGLSWAEEHWNPAASDGWLLSPADHPALDAAVVRQLIAAAASDPLHSIFLPEFAGRRGHPVLLRWGHVSAVRQLAPGEGLNAYLRRQADQTALLPAASADVLVDLDTPEDYERLQQRPW
jgi:molybdenum cofactor cytidylyltransferase